MSPITTKGRYELKSPATIPNDWYARAFDSRYFEVDTSRKPDSVTIDEVKILCSLIGCKTDQRILDLCCGYGRHAVEFAKLGNKVVLVDLDLGASNLHTLLGIRNPKNGLNSFLNQTVKKLDRVAVPTIVSNLFFINSLYCSMEIANLYHTQKLKIIRAITKLPFDYIILDLGAGSNFNTLDFFSTSQEGIIICTPEPTSIENCFRFIKAAYLRKLKQIIKRHAFNSAVKNTVFSPNKKAMEAPDIIDVVLKHDPDRENFLKNKLSEFKFKLIINQFRKNIDETLGDKIETVCNRHFYSNFQSNPTYIIL